MLTLPLSWCASSADPRSPVFKPFASHFACSSAPITSGRRASSADCNPHGQPPCEQVSPSPDLPTAHDPSPLLARLPGPTLLVARQHDAPQTVVTAARALPNPLSHPLHVILSGPPSDASTTSTAAVQRLRRHLKHAQLRCASVSCYAPAPLVASLAELRKARCIERVVQAFICPDAATAIISSMASATPEATLPRPNAAPQAMPRKQSGRVVVAVATDIGEPPAEMAANLAVLERCGCARRSRIDRNVVRVMPSRGTNIAAARCQVPVPMSM